MVEVGQTVRVHYTGTLDDGTVFDTSRGLPPAEFEVGAGTVIPGFEEAVMSMDVGEVKSVRIPPEKAYGLWDERLVETAPMWQIPDAAQMKIGEVFYFHLPDGLPVPVRLLEVDDEGMAHIDMNLPLAGKTLNFEIELVAVL